MFYVLFTKRMKILFLTTHLNAGGITSYLLTLSRGFLKAGNAVHIVSSGGNMSSVFELEGVNLHEVDIQTKSELSPKIYRSLGIVAQIIKENNINVIHAHTRITQVMGQLLKKKTGVVYVSTCHGYFKNRLSRRLAPCWGSRVIAISTAVHTHLAEDFGVEEQKISDVRSGIDVDQFEKVTEASRQKAKESLGLRDAFVIGLIARLSDVKGQDVLLKAVPVIQKEIPGVKVVLIGEGKFKSTLEGIVDELGINHCVIFKDTVNETNSLLPVFDVCVIPSRKEGLGLSVLEAQACGLPVVAANVGGIPDIVVNEKTGILFEGGDSNGLAEKVISLWKDLQKRETLGKNARDFIERECSDKLMVEKTLNVYKLALKE